MADLITLDRFKVALGATGVDAVEDSKRAQAIRGASAVVRSYAGRKFEVATGMYSDRSFDYDGSGIVDIDDALSVISVSINSGFATIRTLPVNEYTLQPMNGVVTEWILMSANAYGIASPQMGFTWNADTYDGFFNSPVIVTVTADWGYAQIPEDVQQATIWVAANILENPRPYISESIEGYARSVGPAQTDAIPERAKEILAPYQKKFV